MYKYTDDNVSHLSTTTQAAGVEVREDEQRQTSWQAVSKVGSDGSQFLLMDDVSDSL